MHQTVKRTVCFIVIIAFSVLILSGCSVTDKLSLLNAMEKTMKIKSMESKSNINLRVGVSGIPQEELEQLKSVLPLDENINIKFNQKYNENGANIDSQIDASLAVGETAVETTIWTNSGISGGEPIMKQIIRIPQILSNSLPPEFAGKEYIVSDQDDLTGNGAMSAEQYNELILNSNKFQQKLVDFLKEYAMDYDPGFAAVNYAGEKTVNGRLLQVYELKLTDESFKKLVRYTFNNIAENEKAKELIKELLVLTAGMPGGMVQGEDLEAALDKFRDGTSCFSEDVNKIMNALDDVRLLGSRGIEAELGIDDDGYIVMQRGVADFVINFHELEKAMRKAAGDKDYYNEEDFQSPNIVLTLDTDFDSELTDINKDVRVVYPEVTSENSVRLEDLMGSIPMPAG